jgi:V/A-type H+-transporting ATPase subunit A
VVEHSLACWANADVVVYVGCGERGNEMTEVLEEFPTLEDPRTGAPLMKRTVLIANTSNMPVAAREASIYTGVTIAEYYRDMGYDVLMLADSTSRWGEACAKYLGAWRNARRGRIPAIWRRAWPNFTSARDGHLPGSRGKMAHRRSGSVTVVGAVSRLEATFRSHYLELVRIAGTFWAWITIFLAAAFPSHQLDSQLFLYNIAGWFTSNVNHLVS